MFASINRPDWRGGRMNMGICYMRFFKAAAFVVMSLPSMSFAQNADAIAEQAKAARNTCFAGVAEKAKGKKVSADTFKLIIDGACPAEADAARMAYSSALDAAVPAGLSFDPMPMKIRYMRAFDIEFTDTKNKMISDYALNN